MLVKLGDLCTIKSSKRIFENEYVLVGIPFIRGQEVSDNSLSNQSVFECYISEDKYDELKEKYGVPQRGDILITAVGTIGNLFYIDNDFKFYYKDGNLLQFTNFRSDINSRYLFYFMHSHYFKKQLQNRLIGAVQKALTMVMLSEIEVPLIPLASQQTIVNTLSNIDNQINRNNNMVKRLQVLAKAIYGKWFIKFKYPGHKNRMVYCKELNKNIPEGWSVVSLGDLLEKNSTADMDDSPKNMIDLSVMPSNDFFLNSLNSSDTFKTNSYIMKKGNILFGSIRPYLKKCGIAPCDGDVSGTVYQFKEKIPGTYNYSLLTMTQDFFFDYALKVSKGTRMPVVSVDSLLSYKLPYNESIVKLFNKLPLQKVLISLGEQNQKLIKIKNSLLPLLINGQLQ